MIVSPGRVSHAEAIHTFKTPNNDPERIELPPLPHPHMQRRRNAPQQHATRHPSNHAIAPAERGTSWLQRNEEGKEQHERRVEIALVEPNVCREVR
jgi:hypothetical protein